MVTKWISPKGNIVVWEADDILVERMKGDWIHYSEDGQICLKCFKMAPFCWVDSEYQYEDNPNRCELRGNG